MEASYVCMFRYYIGKKMENKLCVPNLSLTDRTWGWAHNLLVEWA